MEGAPTFEAATALINGLPKSETHKIRSHADLLGAVAFGLSAETIAGHTGLSESYVTKETCAMEAALGVEGVTVSQRRNAMKVAWAGRLLSRACRSSADDFPVTQHFLRAAKLEQTEVMFMDSLGLTYDDLRLLQLSSMCISRLETAAYFKVSESAIASRKKTLWQRLGRQHKQDILFQIPLPNEELLEAA